MKKNQKGFGVVEALIIAVIILLLCAAGWYVIHRNKDNKQSSPTSSAQNSSSQANNSKKSIGSELVGTWQTACLVPDPNSPWAEKHEFKIVGNEATHTRWSDDSGNNNCSTPDTTIVNHYTYTIPAPGQINLTDTDQQETMYDIYKVSDNTLEFGHGFRNSTQMVASGVNPATRINQLNTYLVYKKQ